MFEKWLQERFVPYFGSGFVLVDNANLQIGLLDKISCTNTRKLVQLTNILTTYSLINVRGVAAVH